MAAKKIRQPDTPVAIIGAGAMGTFVAKTLLGGEVEGYKVTVMADPVPPFSEFLEELHEHAVTVVDSYAKLMQFPVKLVIECANQQVVRECAEFFLTHRVDLVIMSVGALVDPAFFTTIFACAKENGCRIYVPSGAVGAIDVLRAAQPFGLDEVILTTRKPLRSLEDVPGVDIHAVEQPQLIHEGNAAEAVVKFPKNVNVAATLSLAGLGPKRTTVRVVADPGLDRNVHEIQARGTFGSFKIVLNNHPSPKNPKTSYLACMSVVSLLKRIQAPVQIGN
jgi:aspartate dehydrogenase